MRSYVRKMAFSLEHLCHNQALVVAKNLADLREEDKFLGASYSLARTCVYAKHAHLSSGEREDEPGPVATAAAHMEWPPPPPLLLLSLSCGRNTEPL